MDMAIVPTPTPIIHMVPTWATTQAICTIIKCTMDMHLELTTVWVTIQHRISNVKVLTGCVLLVLTLQKMILPILTTR